VGVVAQLCDTLDPAWVFADGRLGGSIATLLLRQSFGEDPVDMFEDAFSGAEVCRDLKNVPWKLRLDRRARAQIRLEVSAAEAVDRLLGIADHEQRSGAKPTAVPRVCASGFA
jgi:hypothetical protein